MRYLLGSIIDWDQLFVEAFKILKPGGYVESYEAAPWITSDDGTVVEGSAMWQWGELFVSSSEALGGRSFTIVPDGVQRKGMEAAGFVDIEEHDIKVNPTKKPFLTGRWPSANELCSIASVWSVAKEPETQADGQVCPGRPRTGHRGICLLCGQSEGMDTGGDHHVCRSTAQGAARY